MVTISHLVLKYVEVRPFLQEAFMQDIVSYASLAKKIRPDIEKELGKKVKHSAVVMALRRAKDKVNKKNTRLDLSNSLEIVLKNNLYNVTVKRKLDSVKKVENNLKSEFIKIFGDDCIDLIFNKTHYDKVKSILEDYKINEEFDLSKVKIKYSEDFKNKPGVIAAITRRLAWNDISIKHFLTTSKEIMVFIDSKKGAKAYNILSGLENEKSNSLL